MQDSRQEKCSTAYAGPVEHGNVAYMSSVPVVIPPGHPPGRLAGLLPSGQGSSSDWNRSREGSSAAVVVPSQSRSSASSTVLSPCDGDTKTTSESSNQSGSVLRERGFIGFTEVSSSPVTASENGTKPRASELDLNLEETDLRLGFGPSEISHSRDACADVAASRSNGYTSFLSRLLTAEQKQNELVAYAAGYPQRFVVKSDGHHAPDWQWMGHAAATDDAQDKRLPPILPDALWQAQFLRTMEGTLRVPIGLDSSTLQIPPLGQELDTPRSFVLNGYPTSGIALAAAKNGVKRAYDEAMAEKRFRQGEIRGTTSAVPETEFKHLSQQTKPALPPFVYNWASVPPSALGTFGPFQSLQHKSIASHPDSAVDSAAPAWELASDCRLPVENSCSPVQPSKPSTVVTQGSPTHDSPPQKGQVIGWPPIRSFRKNTLAAHPKPAEDGEVSDEALEAASGPAKSSVSVYVKVNMDGCSIGRKVDLNAHRSYEALTLALEHMFQRFNGDHGGTQAASGKERVYGESMQLRLINGSDFVLTYEDKEGDWMLVGDVPWGMFVDSVRRLRIMKASEATGLAPRGSRNQRNPRECQEFQSRMM